MQLKDTLEIEETAGGFQPTVEDSFLLNEMDSYPGDTSRFFIGLPNDNSIESSTDDVNNIEDNPLANGIENPVISYQNDISLEDEFDLSAIPTSKPSDFGYDDGRPSSTPFNEDETDGAMFDISTINDFIHSNDQNPTQIVDNTPALEPIRIQLDPPLLNEEPPAKKVKPPKVKKPSKPIDRKVAIIFTMLISSMMVTMSILFLLWKQKQAKEELYAMKASVLNHTSPHGKSNAVDSANTTNEHPVSHTVANIASDSTTQKLGTSKDSTQISSNIQQNTTSLQLQNKTQTENVAHASSAPNKLHSTQHSQKKLYKKSSTTQLEDSDINTLKSNNRTMVSSNSKRVPEYALKVHSSYSKVDAYSKAEQLRKEGIENVTVTEQKIRDRTLYNVRYGKFSTLNEAESASQRTTLPSKWIDRTK